MHSTTTTGYPVGFQDQGAQSQGYASINAGANAYNQPHPPYPQTQQQVYPQSQGYPQHQPYAQQGGYTYGPPGHPAAPGPSVSLHGVVYSRHARVCLHAVMQYLLGALTGKCNSCYLLIYLYKSSCPWNEEWQDGSPTQAAWSSAFILIR